MVQAEFGAFLSQLRKEKGLTQKQLADLLFVSDKAVSRWECGNGYPDISQLQPLSEALGVSLAELLNAKRMDEPASIAVANDAIRSAFTFSEQEIADVRTKLRLKILLVFVGIAVVLNFYFGGAFGWLLGDTFTFERPYIILYLLRHLIAAVTLGMIGVFCLFPHESRLVRFALAGCLCSVAATLIAVTIWRITYGFELMARIDFVCILLFALATVLLIITIMRKKLDEAISLRVILYVASFCVFCPVLFSLVLQNHAPVAESILKSFSLASPMLLLAVFLRIQSSAQVHKPRE
ncbi:MAG: helix-turn-helix transcriptional regulator [Eubacteriales bacterium]|nr:helix-turn-helix transcriptional regulator [Eubacteriales bacterium]